MVWDSISLVLLLGILQNSPVLVEKIAIEGNHHLSGDTLLQGLASSPESSWLSTKLAEFDPLVLEMDQKRIVALYQRHGYFQAEILATRLEHPRADRVVIRLILREGEPARISSVGVVGLPADAAGQELGEALGLSAGQVFDHLAFLQAQEKAKRWLLVRGYAFATVQGQADLSPDRLAIAIQYRVQSGPRPRFGEVSVDGLARVPEQAVLGRVAWKQGEAFDPSRLELTRRRLEKLDRFNTIRLDLSQPARSDQADVAISLTESSRHELRAGVGFGMDRHHYEARGKVGYTQRGFLHPLLTLQLTGKPAYRFFPNASVQGGFGAEAGALLKKDDFLFSRLSLGQSLAYQAEELQTYGLHGLLLRTFLERAFLDDRLVVLFSWNFRNQVFLRIDDAIAIEARPDLGLTDPYRLGNFEQVLAYDRRDNPVETRQGFFAELRLEEGGQPAGGRFAYVKATTEGRGYYAPAWFAVLAGRMRFGSLLTPAGQLPITQRFFSGGASSQRGFAEQRLSPMARGSEGQSVPTGGTTLLESSLETRLNLFQLGGSWLGLALFLDTADVTGRVAALDLAHLHWASGAGLRYQTPVGPLRADVGFRLNRTGAGNPDPGERWAFHLSLGEAF